MCSLKVPWLNLRPSCQKKMTILNHLLSRVLLKPTIKILPKLDHLTPFQYDKKDDPSEDLPAAKILLELPLLTSNASTGPGISGPEPTACHVELEMVYKATLEGVLSERAIDPPATSSS